MELKKKVSSGSSLFAELVKDERKREQVLRELAKNKDSNGADVVIIDDSSLPHGRSMKTNGVRGEVIDITGSTDIMLMDTMSNDSTDTRSSNVPQQIPVLVPGPPPMPVLMQQQQQPQPPQPLTQPPPPPQHHHQPISTIITTSAHASPATVILNNNLMIQTQHQQFMNRAALMAAVSAPPPPAPPPPQQQQGNVTDPKKPLLKSLTTLPLPPGTNVQELVNAKTPSPPRSPRTDKKHGRSSGKSTSSSSSSSHKDTAAAMKNRKSLLNLPMPQMGAGLPPDDGSGDEDYDGKGHKGDAGTNGGRIPMTPSKKKTARRPMILNRRNSRSVVGPGPGGLDWGERSVDVFEVVVQIGEGTYGQVSYLTTGSVTTE